MAGGTCYLALKCLEIACGALGTWGNWLHLLGLEKETGCFHAVAAVAGSQMDAFDDLTEEVLLQCLVGEGGVKITFHV